MRSWSWQIWNWSKKISEVNRSECTEVRKDVLLLLSQSIGSFFELIYKVLAKLGTVTKNDEINKRDERSGTKWNEVERSGTKRLITATMEIRLDEIGWNRMKSSSESSQSFSGTFSSEGLRSEDVQKLWKGKDPLHRHLETPTVLVTSCYI